jgi:hypothetical protein
MTIRLFIGTSANGEDADAEMVYEHSLRKNCSVPIDITWMRQTRMIHLVYGVDGILLYGQRHSVAIVGRYPKFVISRAVRFTQM